jgi:hypothetical protein
LSTNCEEEEDEELALDISWKAVELMGRERAEIKGVPRSVKFVSFRDSGME